ncbi:MAG: DUF4956 domain-containing protein [SAR86 cluster bacterium]|uniref:DUF4956 domain-containing protein n=1 Tax=SAR86 cluster bacterium TaxID=2030880 RepID=A0A2A5AUM2_9GAMM|nr:MAG: DUF4956 domain-containing protein [SAR86 cluster bacterium]
MPVFEILGQDFFIRIAINMVSLHTLIYFGLSGKTKSYGSYFIYYMFGVGVFFVTYILKFEEISLGFAFGLFAIFSMLRYRTEQLTIREMTYLFLVTVVGLLCAISSLNPVEMLVVLGIIVMIAILIESPLTGQHYFQQKVRYEKIDNIKPENRIRLLQDLRERTGLDIHDVQIVSIDFMQDSAILNILYASNEKPSRAPIQNVSESGSAIDPPMES